MRTSRYTSVQLRERQNDSLRQVKHLEFLTFLFGAMGSEAKSLFAEGVLHYTNLRPLTNSPRQLL